MKHAHWHYFAALADDVEKTVRFVEPTPDNFKAYSIEFAKLSLLVGYLYAEDLRDNLLPIKSAGFIRYSQKNFFLVRAWDREALQ